MKLLFRVANCVFTFTSISFILGYGVTACNAPTRNESHANVPDANIEQGRQLANKYCRSCHDLPDPALLDAKTWETGALPAMGPRLGIFNFKGKPYTFEGDNQSRGPGYMAGKAVVTPGEWQKIIDYYTSVSPDELPGQKRNKDIDMKLPLFEILQPALHYDKAHTCFIKINEQDTINPLVTSDAFNNKTYFLNKRLQPVDSLLTDGPLVNIVFSKNTALACNIGILKPNDESRGSAMQLKQKNGKWHADTITSFNGLHRPLQVLPTDLNGDGKTDYLICEFGYMSGSFSWMENTGSNTYKKHLLRQLPGAVRAYPFDYNKDGKMDILALFSQGEEGIFLYTNKGNDVFEEKELLRFPAVYGSSYFELDDFNNDGLMDILYTCGDNGDYTPVLKPYHGVYIYLNKGEKGFEQAYFYPIHGCYKAIARDFDKDGDLDIATVAFYADFASQPEEGFVYLENKGDLNFKAFSSEALKTGRWITMDAGDINGDGWADIVLGNFSQPSLLAGSNVKWAQSSPFVVLQNKAGK